jgi:hypothetical protein
VSAISGATRQFISTRPAAFDRNSGVVLPGQLESGIVPVLGFVHLCNEG